MAIFIDVIAFDQIALFNGVPCADVLFDHDFYHDYLLRIRMGRERARQACLEQSTVTVGRGRYLSGRDYSSTRPQDSVRGIDFYIPATLSLGD